jgi:putative transposase
MQPEKLYHIYNHANGAENFFREVESYGYFLRQWEKYIQPIAHSLAYCLMANHFHFLIKVKEEKELILGGCKTLQGLNASKSCKALEALEKQISLPFSNFFNGYTQAYNKKYKRKGSLFIPNFKQKEITSEAYLSRLIAYIHLNPLHHRFTVHLGQWPLCSYSAYYRTKANFAYALQWFGGREELIDFHEKYLTKTSDLEEGMMQGWGNSQQQINQP